MSQTAYLAASQVTISLFKSVLLILTAVSYRLGLKPPNPPPSKEDNVYYKGQIFEKVVRASSLFSQVSVITCLLSECVVLLSLNFQTAFSPRVISRLCPHPVHSVSAMSTLSPTFLFGISLLIAAAALRAWCYSTLGRFFTFEVTIKREHKLVTSGPYAYVRHPGYTGAVLILLGATVTCLSSGSYIKECQIMETPARWWVYWWMICAAYAGISLLRRGAVEDEGLRKAFGQTWDGYSQIVTCRFVPGVL